MAEFTLYNNIDQLTLTADGTTYGYLGRATLTALVQPTDGPTFKDCGYSLYTIDWPEEIVVALPVKTDGAVALANVTRSGNTHTIRVYKTVNGTGNSAGFLQNAATEVFVFGAPQRTVETACCLFDINGNVCADLTRRPMTYAGVVRMAAGATSVGIPPVGVLAIVGMPNDTRTTSASTPPRFVRRVFTRGWTLFNGQLSKANIQFSWSQEDAATSVQDTLNQVDAIIVEASGL